MIQGARRFTKPTSKSEKRLRSLVAHPLATGFASWGRDLSPALRTTNPSGIATDRQIGAHFGFAMRWTLVLSYPLMAAIQEASAVDRAGQRGPGWRAISGFTIRRGCPTRPSASSSLRM